MAVGVKTYGYYSQWDQKAQRRLVPKMADVIYVTELSSYKFVKAYMLLNSFGRCDIGI